jgi:hypothetical protein
LVLGIVVCVYKRPRFEIVVPYGTLGSPENATRVTIFSCRPVNLYPGIVISESVRAFTDGWEIVHDGRCDFSADTTRDAYSIDTVNTMTRIPKTAYHQPTMRETCLPNFRQETRQRRKIRRVEDGRRRGEKRCGGSKNEQLIRILC